MQAPGSCSLGLITYVLPHTRAIGNICERRREKEGEKEEGERRGEEKRREGGEEREERRGGKRGRGRRGRGGKKE